MGQGLTTALGKDSLYEETRHELDLILQRLRSDDPALTALDLTNRQVGNGGLLVGAPSLVGNEHLLELNLSYNGFVGDEAVKVLCESLADNGKLQKLSLAGNPIGDAGAKAIATYLQSDPPLEELSLYHCQLTDEAVLHLANALQFNSRLVRLNLAMNGLTNASCIMLHKAFTHNKGLAFLDLRQNKTPMDEKLEREMSAKMAEHLEAYNRRKQHEQLKAQKALLRQQREAEQLAERQRQEAEEKARYEAEMAALEARKKAEEREIQLFEAEMAKKRKGLQTGEEAAEKARQRDRERVQKAIETAYEWRDKMTGHGTLVKEWRSGFTIMRTEAGAPPGTMPTVTADPPRRLQACWCDPQDTAAAPYARTLHYHCKYEKMSKGDDDNGEPKYCGCRSTGHVCSSVGFYSQPLPDRSAAYFFASEHPTSAAGIVGE